MFLFTSDWHLTDRPRDEYRWQIFPWLVKQTQLRDSKAIFILGDIADSKNHHSNEFINRLVTELRALSTVCPVYLIPGNHDSTNPDYPLLKFLNKEPLLQFSEPTSVELFGHRFLLVPNQKTQNALTAILKELKASEHKFVLMHQTFRGSITSNGFALKGFDANALECDSTIYISGDVHVPQTIGGVTYCGSPHPVHFGDTFKPRVLLWDGEKLKSIPRTTLRKEVVEITSVEQLKALDYLSEGDQIKVVISVPRKDFGSWETIRQEIEGTASERGLELFGMELKEAGAEPKLKGSPPKKAKTPLEILAAFGKANGIEESMISFGEALVRDATAK